MQPPALQISCSTSLVAIPQSHTSLREGGGCVPVQQLLRGCPSSCAQILSRVNIVQDKLRTLLVSVRALGLEAFSEVVSRLQSLLNDVFEPSAFLVTFLKNVAATAQNAAACAQSLEVVFNMTALVDRFVSPELLQLVTDALSAVNSTVTDISSVVGALDASGVELLYQYVWWWDRHTALRTHTDHRRHYPHCSRVFSLLLAGKHASFL